MGWSRKSGEEASRTRDYWVAKNATLRLAQGRLLRASRLGPSRPKERLLGMTTTKLHLYQRSASNSWGVFRLRKRAGKNPAASSSCWSITRVRTTSNKRSILFFPARRVSSAASANSRRYIAQSGCQPVLRRGTTTTAASSLRAWRIKYCKNDEETKGVSTASIKLSSTGDARNAA